MTRSTAVVPAPRRRASPHQLGEVVPDARTNGSLEAVRGAGADDGFPGRVLPVVAPCGTIVSTSRYDVLTTTERRRGAPVQGGEAPLALPGRRDGGCTSARGWDRPRALGGTPARSRTGGALPAVGSRVAGRDKPWVLGAA